MYLNIHDKIINHYVTTFILIPKLEKYLDHRNIATRKNKGSDYGIKLDKKYLELIKKYNQIYVLKLDISKYFYNIVHDLHLKYYVRYMDDFLIFHYDKHYLEKCLIKIKHQLNNIYHLKVNENKTKIMNIK